MSTEDYINTDYGQTSFDFDDKPMPIPAEPALKEVTNMGNGNVRRTYTDGSIEIRDNLGKVVVHRHKVSMTAAEELKAIEQEIDKKLVTLSAENQKHLDNMKAAKAGPDAFAALKASNAKLQSAIKEQDAQLTKINKQKITYVDQDGNETTVEEEVDLNYDTVTHKKVSKKESEYTFGFVDIDGKPIPAKQQSQVLVTNGRFMFPHEDAKILHAPGRCEQCDQFTYLQQVRAAWEISSTGARPQEITAIVEDNPNPLLIRIILPDPYDARQELINRRLRKQRVAQNVAALNEIEERHV